MAKSNSHLLDIIFVISLILILAIGLSNDNDIIPSTSNDLSIANEKINSFILSKYPTAKNIHLSDNQDDELIDIGFEIKGVKVNAEFDLNENWERTVCHLSKEKISRKILKQIKARYFSPKIISASKIENKEATFFSITISGIRKQDGKIGQRYNHILLFDEKENIED